MKRTKSTALEKSQLGVQYSSVLGGSPLKARMFLMPAALALWSASSMISLLVFVQVKWRTVVTPNSFWHVAAKSSDFSAVEPPAPHVTVRKSGFKAIILDNLASKLRKPASVFGGKNSNEQKRSPGAKLLILDVTVDITKKLGVE